MIITGKIENCTTSTLHARIDFISKSTPLVGSGGVITTNTDKSIRSNPTDGTFSVELVAGNYQVVITAEDQTTTLNIAVPDSSATVSIDTLVSSPLLYPFVAPNTVWNRVLDGSITLDPMADPAAPTTAPVVYGGGHQDNTSSFKYELAWQNAAGDTTKASPDVSNTAPTGANNATRVTLPASPAGATAALIYRSNDGTTARYLLASISPSAGFYDDWESVADFGARLIATQLAPAFNSTAGGITDADGTRIAQFCAGKIVFPTTAFRIHSTKGPQLFNFTTGLWHTLVCQGNPPQLGFDAGES